MLGSDSHCSSCTDDCTDDFAHAAGSCFNGTCVKGDCNPGFADCDFQVANGCEVELGTDDNCGACGDSCTAKFAHSVGECRAGSCRIAYCADYYGDCNANPADGCETALGSEQDCSACGDACADGEDCTLASGAYRCISRGCPDADHDGYNDAACGGTDCDETDLNVNPGAPETCNSKDDNCDGNIDEGEVCASEPSAGCACGSRAGESPGGSLVLLLVLGMIKRKPR